MTHSTHAAVFNVNFFVLSSTNIATIVDSSYQSIDIAVKRRISNDAELRMVNDKDYLCLSQRYLCSTHQNHNESNAKVKGANIGATSFRIVQLREKKNYGEWQLHNDKKYFTFSVDELFIFVMLTTRLLGHY